MVNVFFYICVSLFVFVCLVMIGLVLLQKGRGGGLASAFGGAGGNTAFGSKTGDVLTWATAIVFGVFIVLAVALNLLGDAKNARATAAATQPAVQISEPEAPAAPAAPAAPEAPAVPAPAPAPAVPAVPSPAQ